MKMVLKVSRIQSSSCLAESEFEGSIIDCVVRWAFGLG